VGEPVYLQYPLVGGIDQKTSSIYLDPQSNQADIVNGNFAHVGQIDKRYGMVADTSISTALLLNASTISEAYLPAATVGTALSGFGEVLFQGAFAWTMLGGTIGYVGAMPSCSVVRRPLPVVGSQVPLVLDGVGGKLGTTRVVAWVTQIGASTYSIQALLVDPVTGAGVLQLPSLSPSANTGITLVQLLYLNGLIALFYATYDSGTGGKLHCYTLDPTQANMAWTAQAGATVAIENAAGCCLDVQPFNGDPNHGYIVLYLPTGVGTQLSWAYYSAYASAASGTLGAGTFPGDNPVYIQADYGTDVLFLYSDGAGLGNDSSLYWAYYSGDGAFSSLTSGNATIASMTTVPSGPVHSSATLAGMCRITPVYLGKGELVINNPVSQCYFSIVGTDGTYAASGGPFMPIAFGAMINRDAANNVNVLNAQPYPQGMQPISRPAQVADGLQPGGNAYVHIAHPAVLLVDNDPRVVGGTTLRTLQATLYLLDYRAGPAASNLLSVNVSATAAPRQCDAFIGKLNNAFSGANAAGGSLTSLHLPMALAADGVTMLIPTITAATGIASGISDIVTHWLTSFSYGAPTVPTVARINQTNQISGALPSRLQSASQDNATSKPAAPALLEHGFVHYPEFCFLNAISGGSISSTPTYGYAVVYGRQDGNGAIERSSPDVITNTITLSADQRVEVYFPALAWWATQGQIPQGYFVEIYRTVTAGATYYCVARIYPAAFTATSTPTMFKYIDDPAVNTDGAIEQAEILYTTGGFLDNVNPPGGPSHIAHRSRYAVVDDTLRAVWFTQQETVGSVLGFNEALICPFVEGGDIVALASMDGELVVFKAGSIWLQYGDGPADNGQGSDWTIPQLVPSDVGCTAAPSVQLIPDGLVFLSQKGICLLGRGLQVTFIGKSVQDKLAAYPSCISSVVVPTANHVRWCFQAAGGGQIVVVYDYLLQQWTTYTYSNLDSAIVQLLLIGGQFAILTVLGSRYVEALPTVSAPWLDVDLAAATHFVPTIIATPWFKVSGAQGYQRARRVLVYGLQNDPCGVVLTLETDYQTTVKQSATWAAAQYDGTKPLSMHVGAPFMKSLAVRVVFSDAADALTVTGQGMSFAAIGLDMDKIGDRYRRLPVRNRA
jgi:hypothetical protein